MFYAWSCDRCNHAGSRPSHACVWLSEKCHMWRHYMWIVTFRCQGAALTPLPLSRKMSVSSIALGKEQVRCSFYLTLLMLRLRSSNAKECKTFWKTFKPCHVGIHWKALAEYSQMSTHVPGFQSFFMFLHQPTIPLQIFCESMIDLKVIFKGIKSPTNICQKETSRHEWVNDIS